MLSIIPADSNMLLITLEYDQAEMQRAAVFGPDQTRYETALLRRRVFDRTCSSVIEHIIDERRAGAKVGLTALR